MPPTTFLNYKEKDNALQWSPVNKVSRARNGT